MATPSLHRSFDASLVDAHQSFSSTETGSSTKENQYPKDNAPGRITRDVATEELYSQWAETYDSDGNFLQATDDLQMKTILPELVRNTLKDRNNSRLAVLDFGCGTGRTTMKLVQADWDRFVTINAWDGSAAMLKVARAKCEVVKEQGVSLSFRKVDFSTPENLPDTQVGGIDVVVSTLVLEHIPMCSFWGCISRLLKKGGYGFVSNMHPDMGAKSVAGFDDGKGVRIRGKSWLHGVEETVEGAKR